jgi:hypothetical protein
LKRNLNTLDDFVKSLHKLGYAIIDYHDTKIPCLYVEDSFFEQILKISYGNKMSIDTNLNIYDDGHHIFVEISFNFLNSHLNGNYLLYANENLDFFYNLANAGMLGLSSNDQSKSNVFFIQLPKKDRAEKAFEMITTKLKNSENNIDN